MSFEKIITRLDEIVKSLQSGDLNLDESLALFEEGSKLIKECNCILNEAEQKIKIINLDGSEEDFNSES